MVSLPSAHAPSTARPRRRFAKDERVFAALLVAPGLLVLFATTTAPLIYLLWTSVWDLNLSMPWITGFVGLAHYERMIGDARFWDALQLTAIYTVTTVVLQLAIGLGLALAVLRIPSGQWLFRVAAILPIVLAPVVVGLFWRTLMLAPSFGIFEVVTQTLFGRSYNWLGDPALALASVIMIHTWQWTPFAFLVLLAALASVPPDLYEAARIDRAGPIARFVHITLPLIRPAIIIVVIMRAMIALSAFAAIYAATGGGPGTATQILNLYAYQTSFVELNFGYGSALAVALLVITLAVSGVLFRLRARRG